jgi:hypothetical protein
MMRHPARVHNYLIKQMICPGSAYVLHGFREPGDYGFGKTGKILPGPRVCYTTGYRKLIPNANASVTKPITT